MYCLCESNRKFYIVKAWIKANEACFATSETYNQEALEV